MKELKNNGGQISFLEKFSLSQEDEVLSRRIFKRFPEIEHSFKNLLLFLDTYLDSEFSLFVSGSFAFSARANAFFDIKDSSDIDIWIVVNGSLTSSERHISRALSDLKLCDMVTFDWLLEPRFSIKFLRLNTAQKLFVLEQESLRVLRKKSLLQRKLANMFFGIGMQLCVPVKEVPVKKKFLWQWELCLKRSRSEFVMSDLMSFMIVGFWLRDDLSLRKLKRPLLKEIDDILGRTSNSEMKKLFSYFQMTLLDAFGRFWGGL